MFHGNNPHGRGERREPQHHHGGSHGQEQRHFHHDEDEHEFGGFGRGRGHGRGGHRGGPGDGGRAKRGALRYVLLDALRDGPKHGYEIIKAFEERTQGQYGPSPGTVYPTLQYLEELGLVRADQSAERRVYHLTEAGKAELEAHSEEVKAFWADFGGTTASATSRHEVGFLRLEMVDLMRTVRSGVRAVMEDDNPETIRRVRQAVELCKNEVRRIIAEPRPTAPPNDPQV